MNVSQLIGEQMASRREVADLIKIVSKAGWSVTLTKGGHFKWVSPSGGFFYSAQTPSDHRAIKNIKRDIKNNGLDLTEKKGK